MFSTLTNLHTYLHIVLGIGHKAPGGGGGGGLAGKIHFTKASFMCSYLYLQENMGGPCIILKIKYEGESHKTSFRKHEFFQPTPRPPVLYDKSLSYLLIYYLLFNVIK